MTVPARFALLAWLMSSVVLAGCGYSFPTSPSGDGGALKGAPSGAVITGTMSGLGLATLVTDAFTATATAKPVTVTVVGTNISTVIDGSGKFRLENVPLGDVMLRFTATGLDATLTVFGVEAGDRIDLRVRVTDTSVRLEAENRDGGHDDDDGDDDDDEDDDDDNDEDELSGAVSNRTGTCPALTFTMNGTTVRTNSATDFNLACSQIVNGTRLEVEGVRQFDGSLLATEIERDDEDDDDDDD